MSSCLIDVAQFVYAFGIQMNDSPDIYADTILQTHQVNADWMENMLESKIVFFTR